MEDLEIKVMEQEYNKDSALYLVGDRTIAITKIPERVEPGVYVVEKILTPSKQPVYSGRIKIDAPGLNYTVVQVSPHMLCGNVVVEGESSTEKTIRNALMKISGRIPHRMVEEGYETGLGNTG